MKASYYNDYHDNTVYFYDAPPKLHLLIIINSKLTNKINIYMIFLSIIFNNHLTLNELTLDSGQKKALQRMKILDHLY